MIYQNDQYYLQITLKKGSSYVTDSDCDEMIMKLGNVVKKKSTKELRYSTELNCWLFPLTYEQSSGGISFSNHVQVQAWYSDHSGNYHDSNVVSLKVNSSIINKNDIGDISNGN